MIRSKVHQATNWKRLSLKATDTDQAPTKSTTLYLVLSAELRGDEDVYMFSIDKCYTTIEQANARVELLGQCNTNIRSVETKLLSTDPETGCRTVRWGRYGSQSRFVALVKVLEMNGEVGVISQGNTSPGGWNDPEAEIGAFFAETHLDLPGHIWVVALHEPVSAMDSLTLGRQQFHSRTTTMTLRSKNSAKSSLAAAKALSPVVEDQSDIARKELDLGWYIDSLQPGCEKAVARAKKAWNEYFKDKGRCRKVREHYGFARYACKPALLDKRAGDYVTGVQIRVERVEVVPVNDKPEYFLPASPDNNRIFVPPLRNVDGELISTAAGRRTSFLNSIELIANQSLKYEELPLALRIKQAHLQRWSALSDLHEQKYGQVARQSDTKAADMYHAVLLGSDTLSPNKRVSARRPSSAYESARARMQAAFEEKDNDEDEDEVPITQAKVSEKMKTMIGDSIKPDMTPLRIQPQVLRRKPQRTMLKSADSMLVATQSVRTDTATGQQAVEPLNIATMVKRMGSNEQAGAVFGGLWF
ncbi:hypothetical protein LTR17_015806 [Elasticomyces elasticus]|nr:hypothetical protein LTR17_015806 [Elasticomyces elasticus]